METHGLEKVLQQARANNASKGITGALVYVDGVFLQILEGERAALQALMAKITKDLRHEKVTILKDGEVPRAVFTDWKMAYVSATHEQVAKWAGFGGTVAIPKILDSMRQDPRKAEQLAEGILSLLDPETADPETADPETSDPETAEKGAPA